MLSRGAAISWSALGAVVAACSSNDSRPQAQPIAGDVPCDVAHVLAERCASCHGTILREGAPVPLLTAADFVRDSGGQSIAQIASFRIKDVGRPMPPPPLPPLTAAEIAALDGWLMANAPPKVDGCAVIEPAPPAGTGGSTSSGGAPVTGGVAGSSSGGVAPGTGGTPGTGGAIGSGGAGGMASGGTPGSGGAGGGTGGGPPVTTGWSMFGGDLGNSRNNPATALKRASFGSLRRIWQFEGPAVTSTPAVVEGTVYFAGWDAKVHARNAADGAPVWTATVPHLVDSSPAVTSDRVFVGDNNGNVHSLNRASGAIVWSKPAETVGLPHLWSSPIVIPDAGIVVVGVASAEESNRANTPFSFRGSVVALDAATGNPRWQFYTTKGDTTSGPGVGIWSTVSVDPALKLLYVGTGNAYVAPAGPHSDALLAIRYDTGVIEWAHQFQADDVFEVYTAPNGVDSDVGSTANVFSAGGKDLVGIGVKNGIYYALDRKTGVQVWQRRVSAGSVLGGVMGASAYANGVVYAAGNERSTGKTTLMAINATDGNTLWSFSAASSTYGALAYANGVVYMGTTGGTLYAIDAVTGQSIWSDVMPNGIGGGPSLGDSLLFAPWGFVFTLLNGTNAGKGGLIAYGP